MSQTYRGNPWTVAGVKQAIAAYEETAAKYENSSDPFYQQVAESNRREAEWCRQFLAAHPNAY